MTASVHAGVWDLTPNDRLLVEAKRWDNRLRFAVMHLFFRGHFPRTMAEVDEDTVAGLSSTLGVPASDNGRLIFAIFAGLAEFERELIVERTKAGLASARAGSPW